MFFDEFPNALVLTGPTASGKTVLGLQLAERLGAEIVSMDSMALYRGMDIGTAKPGTDERARVPHHLVDVLDPWESASVAWWLAQTLACCRDIARRGRAILVVGGTPLYLKTLLCGMFAGPPADPVLRQRLQQEADSVGREVLHQRLRHVDPKSAGRLHPNDVRRIIRALEVWELTRRPISEWQNQWNSRPRENDEPGASATHIHCLNVPRHELYARIDARVQRMIADGLVHECEKLRQLSRPLSREASQALGYQEVFAYLDGQLSVSEMVLRIQTRTRQFAKRQLTWFRHLPSCRMITTELTISSAGLTIPLSECSLSTQS